ncbi:MAG: ribonuclease P protein component [Candidatus Saccharibacteria bacterium]|nr:ribonuclease P protein component [Candidatus Saccharibacteria bacterium]
MINKKYRFHSRGGVRYAYKEGKTIRTAKMSLVFVENKRKFTRIAVVVSKKVEKTAVKRNRIRRRVYEALRVNFQHIPKGYDYVFIIYSKDVLKMPFGELEGALGELVEKSAVCYNVKNR